MREIVFTSFFGASYALDAFITAFRIPNLLRDLFAEGALSQAFVTIFSQVQIQKDTKAAHALANKVITLLLIFLGSFVLLSVIFSSQLMSFFIDQTSTEKLQLAIILNQILFPFILFVSIGAIYMGMLNAHQKFFLPQSASTFFNLTSIIFGILIGYLMAPEYITQVLLVFFNKAPANNTVFQPIEIARAITGFAVGTLLGGIVQCLIQLPTLIKLGFKPKLDFDFLNPELKKVLKLSVPAIIGGSAVQVNVMVNTIFANSLADGSISYLNCAFRLMQFPLGVFGVAIAIASAPTLAKMIAQNKNDDFKKVMSSSMQMSLFLSIPSTIGLIILAKPIISLIYEYGLFSAHDTQQTALALMYYALGIISYSCIKIYQPAFLALNDAKTPMRISLISIFFNLVFNWTFIHYFQWSHWSLALGTALVAFLNFSFLAFLLERRGYKIWNQSFCITIIKIIFCGLAMGTTLYLTFQGVTFFLGNNLFGIKLIKVFVPIVTGGLVYFLCGLFLNLDEARSLKKKFSR